MRKGTTLLELVIVVAIVALMAQIAVVYAKRSGSRTDHHLACQLFMTELAYAQQLSRGGSAVRVMAVKAQPVSYYVVFQDGRLLHKADLPAGIYFDSYYELTYINGKCPFGKTFRISAQSGASSLVVVSMSTNRIRLERIQ